MASPIVQGVQAMLLLRNLPSVCSAVWLSEGVVSTIASPHSRSNARLCCTNGEAPVVGSQAVGYILTYTCPNIYCLTAVKALGLYSAVHMHCVLLCSAVPCYAGLG